MSAFGDISSVYITLLGKLLEKSLSIVQTDLCIEKGIMGMFSKTSI